MGQARNRVCKFHHLQKNTTKAVKGHTAQALQTYNCFYFQATRKGIQRAQLPRLHNSNSSYQRMHCESLSTITKQLMSAILTWHIHKPRLQLSKDALPDCCVPQADSQEFTCFFSRQGAACTPAKHKAAIKGCTARNDLFGVLPSGSLGPLCLFSRQGGKTGHG